MAQQSPTCRSHGARSGRVSTPLSGHGRSSCASHLAPQRVSKVTDIVKEGDQIRVKVLEINRDGKIRLSRKAVLNEENDKSSR